MLQLRSSLQWVRTELEVMKTNSDCKEEREKLDNMANLVSTGVWAICEMETQQVGMAKAIEKLKKLNKK